MQPPRLRPLPYPNLHTTAHDGHCALAARSNTIPPTHIYKKQVALILAGQAPGWYSALIPRTRAALLPTLSAEFRQLMSSPVLDIWL